MEDLSVTEAEDISLRFRTTQQHGLLFITSTDNSLDKMELYIESGSVRLNIKMEQTSKVLITCCSERFHACIINFPCIKYFLDNYTTANN